MDSTTDKADKADNDSPRARTPWFKANVDYIWPTILVLAVVVICDVLTQNG